MSDLRTPRYILNDKTHRIHDKEHLTERCNTDQLVRREDIGELEKDQLVANGWKQCAWCKE